MTDEKVETVDSFDGNDLRESGRVTKVASFVLPHGWVLLDRLDTGQYRVLYRQFDKKNEVRKTAEEYYKDKDAAMLAFERYVDLLFYASRQGPRLPWW